MSKLENLEEIPHPPNPPLLATSVGSDAPVAKKIKLEETSVDHDDGAGAPAGEVVALIQNTTATEAEAEMKVNRESEVNVVVENDGASLPIVASATQAKKGEEEEADVDVVIIENDDTSVADNLTEEDARVDINDEKDIVAKGDGEDELIEDKNDDSARAEIPTNKESDEDADIPILEKQQLLPSAQREMKNVEVENFVEDSDTHDGQNGDDLPGYPEDEASDFSDEDVYEEEEEEVVEVIAEQEQDDSA